MHKILFVCHGNICRSPMAEFIMKDLVRKAGRDADFEIASCAASREEEGCGMYPPARRELMKHNVPCGDHRARQITRKDLEYYDRIYYMDSRNRSYLMRMFPDFHGFQQFLDRDEFAEWEEKADIVITHGGTGAIIGAVKKGKKVIAVPRLAKYGEHVDDHQLQLIDQFKEQNLICGLQDCSELPSAMEFIKTASFEF